MARRKRKVRPKEWDGVPEWMERARHTEQKTLQRKAKELQFRLNQLKSLYEKTADKHRKFILSGDIVRAKKELLNTHRALSELKYHNFIRRYEQLQQRTKDANARKSATNFGGKPLQGGLPE